MVEHARGRRDEPWKAFADPLQAREVGRVEGLADLGLAQVAPDPALGEELVPVVGPAVLLGQQAQPAVGVPAEPVTAHRVQRGEGPARRLPEPVGVGPWSQRLHEDVVRAHLEQPGNPDARPLLERPEARRLQREQVGRRVEGPLEDVRRSVVEGQPPDVVHRAAGERLGVGHPRDDLAGQALPACVHGAGPDRASHRVRAEWNMAYMILSSAESRYEVDPKSWVQ